MPDALSLPALGFSERAPALLLLSLLLLDILLMRRLDYLEVPIEETEER